MIQKNGTITANIFSTNGLLENMEQKYFEGAQWAKIFEHNNHAGTVLFSSLAECLHSETKDKYSRIYLLDTMSDKSGKYEFLLQYPDNDSVKYNRWKQTNNPCKEFVTTTSAGTGVATGYEAIHIDWNQNYWGGITRQSSDTSAISPTYLSGSVGHTNWYYAIGCTSAWNGGIPGPNIAITARAQLWVRIDNLQNETKAQITKAGCMSANGFYEV